VNSLDVITQCAVYTSFKTLTLYHQDNPTEIQDFILSLWMLTRISSMCFLFRY